MDEKTNHYAIVIYKLHTLTIPNSFTVPQSTFKYVSHTGITATLLHTKQMKERERKEKSNHVD